MRNRTINLALFLFVFFLISCVNRQNTSIDKVFPEKISIQGDMLEISNLFIGSPHKVLTTKNLLILVDNINSKFIKIIDIESKEIIAQFGEKGRGPGEIVQLSDVWIDERNNRLELYDSKMCILYSLSLDSLESPCLAKAKKIHLNNVPDNFTRMRHSKLLRLNDSLIVTSGFFDSGRFVLLDGDGEFMQTYDDFEFYGEEFSILTDIEKSIALQGQFAGCQKFSRFVFSTTKSACIQIYNYEGQNVSVINKLKYFVAPGKSFAGSVATSREIPFAFMDMAVSDKNIFLLYSGKRIDNPNVSVEICERIFVYDWDGLPVRELKTDFPLTKVCYNKEMNAIIGVSVYPEPNILIFPL